MVAKQVKKIIGAYRKSLENKIKVDKLILFGSWARGEQTSESDLDLLVISTDFAKLSERERFSLLWDARDKTLTRKIDMDVFGLTPQEMARVSGLTTLEEIRKKGIVV